MASFLPDMAFWVRLANIPMRRMYKPADIHANQLPVGRVGANHLTCCRIDKLEYSISMDGNPTGI